MIPAARPDIREVDVENATRVIRSGNLAQGDEVHLFEREFSQLAVEGAHSIAVNSGTSALHLALVALGVGPGDEVVVPSFTFAATANSVAFTGATPVFADINPSTFTICPESVSAAISSNTRGVVPVHLYGQPADLSSLSRICEDNGIWLLEDAAQAHLAAWEGKHVGSWGVAAAFSFYPTKNMTSGEGGMVTTRSPDIAKTLKLLRNQGQERRYENEIVGLNNRMTDIHAAIGRSQLGRLQENTLRRRQIAEVYFEEIKGVQLPSVDSRAFHVFHQFTIRVPAEERDSFVEQLRVHGVGVGIYYPTPVHRLPAFNRSSVLPATEAAAQGVVSLPVYPSLTESDIEHICSSVNSVAAAGA